MDYILIPDCDTRVTVRPPDEPDVAVLRYRRWGPTD